MTCRGFSDTRSRLDSDPLVIVAGGNHDEIQRLAAPKYDIYCDVTLVEANLLNLILQT